MAAGVFSSSPTNSMSLSTPSQQPRTPLACPPGVGGTSPASASGSGEKVGGGTSVGGSLRRTSSGVASGDASTDKKPPLPPRGVPLNGGGDEAYNRHRRQRSNLTEQLAKAENLELTLRSFIKSTNIDQKMLKTAYGIIKFLTK